MTSGSDERDGAGGTGRPSLSQYMKQRAALEPKGPSIAYRTWREQRFGERIDAVRRAGTRLSDRKAAARDEFDARMRAFEQMPRWVASEALLGPFVEARRATALTGRPHVVAHVVPLRGEDVCGLHVPWNLAVVPRDPGDDPRA